MRIAIVIQRWFAFGGLQRDCRALAEALHARGYAVRLYCRAFRGEPWPGVTLCRLPVRALGNHRRDALFAARVRQAIEADPVDAVFGFDRMPGLDLYFAGDSPLPSRPRGALHRLGGSHRQRAADEAAVFGPGSGTQILLLCPAQRDAYLQRYPQAASRLHLLPPAVPAARAAAAAQRALRRPDRRAALGLGEQEFTLLFVASGWHTKGLDRVLQALGRVVAEQPAQRVRLLVAGEGNVRRYRRLARRLGIADAVSFLGGREDIPDLMLAADLLVHPARAEAGGMVLLEAIAAGLPIVASGLCGYAPHVRAARAGLLLEEPFTQDNFERAVLRMLDGVLRADCRDSAQHYAEQQLCGDRSTVFAGRIDALLARKRAADDG